MDIFLTSKTYFVGGVGLFAVVFLFSSSVENSTNSADASSNKFVFGQNMSERVLVSIQSEWSALAL